MSAVKVFLYLGLLEGIAVITWLLSKPSEAESAWLLGYSLFRWLMAVWVAQGTLSFGGIIFCKHLGLPWINELGKHVAGQLRQGKWFMVTIILTLLGSISGLYFIGLTTTIGDAQIQGYFQRFTPLIAWVTLISFQALSLVIILFLPYHFPGWRGKIQQISLYIKRYRTEIIALCILILISYALFWHAKQPHLPVSRATGWDYVVHTRFAERMAETHKIETSFFLYEILVIAAHILSPDSSYLVLGKFIALIFDLLTVLVVYALLHFSLRNTPISPPWKASLCAGLALILNLVTPITIPTWRQHNLYFGYIGINVYHNPTYLLLKPLALLLFTNTLGLITNASLSQQTFWNRIVQLLILALLTTITVLAKPNFIICLLPALALWAVFCIHKKQPMDWLGIILGIGLPAATALVWQYLATYTSDRVLRAEAGITFAPMAVFSQESNLLLLKFLLSIIFPLTVYILYAREAVSDIPLNFAWLNFAFGAFFTYFFAETGLRFQDGNFKWSGQVTLFILFTISVIFFIKKNTGILTKNSRKTNQYMFWVGTAMFGLHLISGVLFYLTHLIQPDNPWW